MILESFSRFLLFSIRNVISIPYRNRNSSKGLSKEYMNNALFKAEFVLVGQENRIYIANFARFRLLTVLTLKDNEETTMRDRGISSRKDTFIINSDPLFSVKRYLPMWSTFDLLGLSFILTLNVRNERNSYVKTNKFQLCVYKPLFS